MGSHPCAYCDPTNRASHQFYPSSTGDVRLTFADANGHPVIYEFPDMIFHYVVDHQALLPPEFVYAINNFPLTSADRFQTKGAVRPIPIMYLDGPFVAGFNDPELIEKLWLLVTRSTEGNSQMMRYDEYRVEYEGSFFALPADCIRYNRATLGLLNTVVAIHWDMSPLVEPSIGLTIVRNSPHSADYLVTHHGAPYARCLYRA